MLWHLVEDVLIRALDPICRLRTGQHELDGLSYKELRGLEQEMVSAVNVVRERKVLDILFFLILKSLILWLEERKLNSGFLDLYQKNTITPRPVSQRVFCFSFTMISEIGHTAIWQPLKHTSLKLSWTVHLMIS